jgi:2'-5' RNA ligase
MAANEMVGFWLVPAGKAKEHFTALIAELSRRCDAPVFEPHVTLGSGEITEEHARRILLEVSPLEPIDLEIERISFTEQYTKTLFVQFHSSPVIEALSSEIQRAADRQYELNPHLSLLYKQMPALEKAELARAISIPFSRVSFDIIKAISTPHPITRRDDVEAWRTIGERMLGAENL